MVPDPYLALKLSHSATQDEIKKSYRELARTCHPDRVCAGVADENEAARKREEATAHFAKISSAYALLSDPKRKSHYDHVYKFGGYDDDQEEKKEECFSYPQHPQQSSGGSTSPPGVAKRHARNTGIGYTCFDPLAFIWTNGKVQSKMAVAGIQIPSRLQTSTTTTSSSSGPIGGGGLRFAFSSGKIENCHETGTKQFTTQTTQFAHGKKYTKTETTTVHPDGRKEIITQGNNFFERRVIPPPPQPESATMSNAGSNDGWWTVVKDRLSMCHNPCSAIESPRQRETAQ